MKLSRRVTTRSGSESLSAPACVAGPVTGPRVIPKSLGNNWQANSLVRDETWT